MYSARLNSRSAAFSPLKIELWSLLCCQRKGWGEVSTVLLSFTFLLWSSDSQSGGRNPLRGATTSFLGGNEKLGTTTLESGTGAIIRAPRLQFILSWE